MPKNRMTHTRGRLNAANPEAGITHAKMAGNPMSGDTLGDGDATSAGACGA